MGQGNGVRDRLGMAVGALEGSVPVSARGDAGGQHVTGREDLHNPPCPKRSRHNSKPLQALVPRIERTRPRTLAATLSLDDAQVLGRRPPIVSRSALGRGTA